jgi:polyisoprenyl-teichoic acid--peptidoglycan teichoic acid transferase
MNSDEHSVSTSYTRPPVPSHESRFARPSARLTAQQEEQRAATAKNAKVDAATLVNTISAPQTLPKTPVVSNVPSSTAPLSTFDMPSLPDPYQDRQSAARERMRKRKLQRRTGGEWAWVVIAAALISVVLIISTSVVLITRVSEPVSSNGLQIAVLPTAVLAQTNFSENGAPLITDISAGDQVVLDDGRQMVLQPWTGGTRLTVLVMGLDRRPNEEGFAYRTDTMMLLSFDRDSNSLGIMSIPRDLYVDVPGYDQLQRINSAMVLGELQQPNYGPTLAMQTVQYNFGMYVHHYVAMDFQAVVELTDIIGGVDIDVPYRIEDYEYPDMNFGYDPLILEAGMQHMDGATLLKFARTRHGDNDFERARRQQIMLFALRDQILDFNLLPQLIVQSPTLLRTFNENVYTSLSLDQLIQLALSLKDVPTENIQTGVIDDRYIMPYTTDNGAQVLVPRRAQLAPLLTDVFGDTYNQ